VAFAISATAAAGSPRSEPLSDDRDVARAAPTARDHLRGA
jgi:hypothetical protein